MTNPITIALHKPTDKFVHVDSIEPNDRNIRDHCYCLKCNDKLDAVLVFIKDPRRKPFFRHHTDPDSDCQGSQETALHELAKQILVDNSHIATKEHGIISYTGAVAEKRLEQVQPDVTATAAHDNKPVYFEVYVSHAVDIGKEKFLVEGQRRSLEIDLSDNRTTTSFEEIKRLVLDEPSNKKIIFWEKEENLLRQFLLWVGGIFVASEIIKAILPRKRR